jgi:hypothetical protein
MRRLGRGPSYRCSRRSASAHQLCYKSDEPNHISLRPPETIHVQRRIAGREEMAPANPLGRWIFLGQSLRLQLP